MIKLPRVYNSNLVYSRTIHPIRVSLTQNATPLSYASIEVQKGEGLASREFVEIFTPYGTSEYYRVCVPGDTYGNATTASQMEHAISEVGDYLVKEEISEMRSASAAMKTIFSHYKGSHWKLGDVSALTGSVAVEVNYDRVLDAMLAILEQKTDCMLAFDFSTKPWTVKVVKKSTAVNAEGRLSRNLISARISYDDSELCTRAYYKTYSTDKKGNTTETWNHRDTDTLSKYGVVEREVSTSSDMTDAEISTAVSTFLNEHKQPKFSVEISAEELSQITGEPLDKFELGKLMRLAIPDYGVVIEEHINSITWSDVYNAPELMTVKLGDDEDTVVSFLHKVDASTVSSGKSTASVKRTKLYETKIDQTDKLIDMYAQHLDKYGNILQQAGLDINAEGVLIYATDNERNLASMLNVQADRISLVVEGTGPNAKIKPASIVAAINNGRSSVKIDANHIKIGSGSSTISLDGAFTVNNGNLTVKKNLYMDWGNTHSKIYTQGGVSFVGASGSQGIRAFDLNYNVLSDMVKVATKTGDTLTLEKFSGEIINFSKATSLSGSWGGGTYTVTASPQGVKESTQVFKGTGAAFERWDGNIYTGTIVYLLPDGEHYGSTGRTFTVNASERYTAGQNSVTVDSIGLASNYSPLDGSSTRSNIFIQAVASNGAVKNDKLLQLAKTTYSSGSKQCVNLTDGSSVIGRINIDPSHTVKSFATFANSGDTFSGHTNNSDGYYISGTGRDRTVGIVVKGTWTCDGVSREGLNFLQAAPKKIFQKGWDEARNAETRITMTRGAYNSQSKTYTCTCTLSSTIATGSTFYLYAR